MPVGWPPGPGSGARSWCRSLAIRPAIGPAIRPGSGLEVDLRLTVTAAEWQGLGQGHGHLTARRVVVEATGRRRAARARRAELWLPDGRGRILAVARESARPLRLETVASVGSAGSGSYAGPTSTGLGCESGPR